MPEAQMTCGNCDNYCKNQLVGELEGYCRVVPSERKGEPGKSVRFDTDANQCPKFEKLTRVYTDAAQMPFDPGLRIYGGHEDVKSDRLVFERHEREKEGR